MSKPVGKASAWIVFILVIVALAATNPSEQTHRAKIVQAVHQSAVRDGFWGAVMAVTGGTDAAVDMIPLEYHNYLIFSTVSCKNDRVSIGFLGNVILSH